MNKITTNHILWLVYISLLAVLLPHTAWAFAQFEPSNSTMGTVTSWAAAFAFESAIAALTHKLAKHIETVPNRHNKLRRWSERYLNTYSLALLVALGVSSLANLAHAVEFGQEMQIFTTWGISFGVYALAFGAILPVVSYTFASVLSNVTESEQVQDEQLVAANRENRDLKRQLREANNLRMAAEQRFQAAGDLVAKLFANEKRERILAARELWDELPGASIAVIAGTSRSYVSEVLSEKAEQVTA